MGGLGAGMGCDAKGGVEWDGLRGASSQHTSRKR